MYGYPPWKVSLTQNDGARQKRRIHLEIRIFRCGSDQNDRAVLDKRKQIVLLSLVETMDLIDKQDRFLSIHALIVFAAATTSSMSFLPAEVALICMNSALVVLAITFASVVFPVPGGP